ncbi:MAG TPA: bacteriohemerythrin [Anaeromyxobacteraceae bacterium]|nr:bacteriohemerythrin [Anaeromyxobacteraceae bacterium]
MSQTDWDTDLRVGEQEMDVEHELQVGLVRALDGALGAGSREEASRIFEQLLDYTRVHFAAEELMMRLHAYSGFGEHELEHSKLLDQLNEVRSAFEGGQVQPTKELVTALRHWLSEHIQTFDRGLALHLRQPSRSP